MHDPWTQPERTIFTIGHSNHPAEKFLDLLRRVGVQVVADVRTSPYCAYATHFNKEPLDAALAAAGVKYLFLGDALGGRPDAEEFYDDEGRVRYDRLAASAAFRGGIQRLLTGIAAYRVALMCGEEDPTGCHRRLLIGRVLGQQGVRVLHLRGDGRLETEEEVARQEALAKTGGQKTLFDVEDTAWKSIRSVSPKRPRPSSSDSSSGLAFGG